MAAVFVDHLLPAHEVGEDGYPQLSHCRLGLAAVCILLPLALLFSGEQLLFIYFEF
jgi:hypothetical protein